MRWRSGLSFVLSVGAHRTTVESLCVVPARSSSSVAARRPSKDDVERISWGKPAKRKGTGSRGVPHRLNADERVAFEAAKRKGFVELDGTGYRAERRDAPLVNTWRNWCDALGAPAVCLHKNSGATTQDTVVVDLSPLRAPEAFDDAATLMTTKLPGAVNNQNSPSVMGSELDAEADWLKRPIHQLPRYDLVWAVADRSDAKALAKQLSVEVAFPVQSRGVSRPRRLDDDDDVGDGKKKKKVRTKAPNVKPGKSRRHGGFGIGS